MFVEREAELHSWNDWYDIHARLELWVNNGPKLALAHFQRKRCPPVTFSQRSTTWRVLYLIACPSVAQRFAKKTRRCELTKGGRYSPSVLHQQSCLYFTICSPCPDPICLMAFTGESNYREWKHSGESQSRHIDTHSLSWTSGCSREKAA